MSIDLSDISGTRMAREMEGVALKTYLMGPKPITKGFVVELLCVDVDGCRCAYLPTYLPTYRSVPPYRMKVRFFGVFLLN